MLEKGSLLLIVCTKTPNNTLSADHSSSPTSNLVGQELNNFGFVRLAAAVLVIIGHSYVLTGNVSPTWFHTDVSSFAIRIFFVISGYLICESWNRDPVLWRFLVKRLLRIAPGLIVVVAIAALVLGPIVTSLSLAQYLADPSFASYFWNIALAPIFQLPGVFLHTGVSAAVNGSLWSLPVEFAMYLLVPLYGNRNRALCRTVLFPLALGAAILGGLWFTVVAPAQMTPVLYWTSLPALFRTGPYFLMGAAFSIWRLERFLSLPVAAVMAGALAFNFHSTPLFEAELFLLTPFMVLAFALTPQSWLSRVGRRVDVSYGVYLYAFPIQQLLISEFGILKPLAIVAWTTLLSIACGWLSWHCVEHPALRLKPWQQPLSPQKSVTAVVGA